MRILIADDEQTARKRLTRLLSAMEDITIVGEVDNGTALLEQLRKTEVDVVLLDIQMPGLTGLEAAAFFPENHPYIIFVTAHPEHALQAFDTGAVDYVLKPVAAARLKTAIERARARRIPKASSGKLPIRTRSGIELIDPDQLSHAEFDGYLVTLHVGRRFITTELTLSQLESQLDSARFVRVHRRHILNFDCVERLEPLENGGYIAKTKQGDRVPVSRQTARAIRRKFQT